MEKDELLQSQASLNFTYGDCGNICTFWTKQRPCICKAWAMPKCMPHLWQRHTVKHQYFCELTRYHFPHLSVVRLEFWMPSAGVQSWEFQSQAVAGSGLQVIDLDLQCWVWVCITTSGSALLSLGLHSWVWVCTSGSGSAGLGLFQLLGLGLHCSVWIVGSGSALLGLHCWVRVWTVESESALWVWVWIVGSGLLGLALHC